MHVTFGDSSRRAKPSPQSNPPQPNSSQPSNLPLESDRSVPPILDLPHSVTKVDSLVLGDKSAFYSLGDASRVLGIPRDRLRYWSRSELIQPSYMLGRRRYYTFRDLLALRVASSLLKKDVPLQRVRECLRALQHELPDVVHPLAELRVVADGRALVVKSDDGNYEPDTGQYVMDFGVHHVGTKVRQLRSGDAAKDHRQLAYEQYLRGCSLDETEATMGEAEAAYLRAIKLDPALSNAYTNLGNLRFRKGLLEEAEELYRHALRVDPVQPEAAYNLGFLCFERGETSEAVRFFQHAIDHDPMFADAHFNLAMAYEESDTPGKARDHWSTYLQLDPAGPWAEIARRHLNTQQR